MPPKAPGVNLVGPPVDGVVLSTSHRQTLVALAYDAKELTKAHAFLRGLTMAGHSVTLMWSVDQPGAQLDMLDQRHIVKAGPRTLVTAVAGDPQAQALLSRADGVLGFGARARAHLEQIAAGRTAAVPRQDLVGWQAVARVWTQLRARADADALTVSYARHLARLAHLLEDQMAPDDSQALLTDFLAELVRSGQGCVASRLLGHLRMEDPDPVEAARRRAVVAQVRTSARGREDPDLLPSATDLIAATDRVLLDGDVERAAALATVCLGSLFHADLHASVLSSPLIDDPGGFMSSWRSSETGKRLGSSSRGNTRPDDRVASAGTVQRVLVAPGSYPRFAVLVTEELRSRAGLTVDVLEWEGRPDAIGLGLGRELIAARLREVMGHDVREPDLMARLAQVDAAFVDWADRGAALILRHLPDTAHVTVRIHSMDALSAWVHVIDWSRVDNLVLVSEHLREVVAEVLGSSLASTAVHVVGVAVDETRIPTDKTPGHLRRMLMVGWAPAVKDVMWALDVLRILRTHDAAWTLTLVGPRRRRSRPGCERTEDMLGLQQILDAAVQDGSVHIVDETEAMAPHWQSAGFALNTSRRESFGLAIVEGAAAGCVPVVRNWPLFASRDAARRLFPAEWVVDTAQEAADRVLHLADEERWSAASKAARASATERFLTGDPTGGLADIIVGQHAP